jgi:hypothetical protein
MRRMRTCSMVLLLSAVLLLPGASALAGSRGGGVKSLTIVSKTIDRDRNLLVLDLQNQSRMEITAWSVSVVTGADHGRGARAVHTTDVGWISSATTGSSPSEGIGTNRPIAPGETRQLEFTVDSEVLTSSYGVVAAEIVGIVFRDLSTEGAPEYSDAIVHSRSARQQALRAAAGELRLRGSRAAGELDKLDLRHSIRSMLQSIERPFGGIPSSALVESVLDSTIVEIDSAIDSEGKDPLRITPDQLESIAKGLDVAASALDSSIPQGVRQ